MWPDRVLNPGSLTYESDALLTALRSLAPLFRHDRYLSQVTSVPHQGKQLCNFHSIGGGGGGGGGWRWGWWWGKQGSR